MRTLAACTLLVLLVACSQGREEGEKTAALAPRAGQGEQAGAPEAAADTAPRPPEAPAGAARPSRAGACPPAETYAQTIAATFREGIIVKEVGPGPFDGLCEVVISFNGRNDILYSDATGRYFLTGRSVAIVDAQSKTNLTRARLSEFNKFTPEDMAKVDSLTALSMGTKGPVVYFVTDPM